MGHSRPNGLKIKKELVMEQVEYKNKRIEFEESSNPKIVIDGQAVAASHDAEAKEFSAGELPYRVFNSVKELAEAIVDRRG